MYFQVKTTLGREEIAAYEAITGKTVQRVRRTLLHWGLLVLGLLSLSFTAVGLAMGGFGAGGVLGLGLGAVALVWGLNWNGYLVWKSSRAIPPGFTQTFFFGGEEMVVTVGDKHQLSHRYDRLYALAEGGGYYVLYLSKFNSYLLPKAGFLKGQAADFPAFLQQRAGKAFTRVNL